MCNKCNDISEKELKQSLEDYAYWKQIEQFLGPDWQLVGFTFKHAATFSSSGKCPIEMSNILSEKILALINRVNMLENELDDLYRAEAYDER